MEFDVEYHANYLERSLRGLAYHIQNPPKTFMATGESRGVLEERVVDALDEGNQPNKREEDDEEG